MSPVSVLDFKMVSFGKNTSHLSNTNLLISTYILKVIFAFLCLSVTVANGNGKVQIVCIKSTPDIHWSTLGKTLNDHNTYIEYSKYSKYDIV